MPGFDRHGGGPGMSRLRCRAWTGNGSVSRLLPTRRRRRPRRQAPPEPSPGSYLPPPACMSERHRRPLAKSPPLLHVRRFRTAPTLVGKVSTLLHVRTAPTSMGHVNPQIPYSAHKHWLDVFTSKSRAHGSISAAVAGRPDSYNTTNSKHNFMCRAPSTAVDDSLWHGADVGSSLTSC